MRRDTCALLALLLAVGGPALADRAPKRPAIVLVSRSLVVSEGGDRIAVRRTLRERLGKADTCRPAGRNDPPWSVAISFSILDGGKLVGLKIVGPDAKTASCVKRLLADLTFPSVKRTGNVESEWRIGYDRAREAARTAGILGTLGSCPDDVCVKVVGKKAGFSRRGELRKAIELRSSGLKTCLAVGERIELGLRVSSRGRSSWSPKSSRGSETCAIKAVRKVIFSPGKNTRVTVQISHRAVMGGLVGAKIGPGYGGLGVRGGGGLGSVRGGGGTGVGIGGIGRGSGGATGSGYGRGSTRGRRTATVRIGRLRVVGDLDRNIIRRYLRRQLNAFRACYERELARNPKLSGTVRLEVTVEGSGQVSRARAFGDTNGKVRSCLAQQARRIRFPRGRTGAKSQIRVPMTFVPTP